MNKFFQISSVPARQFLQLIGFLISLMDVIPLGRLHIRPIQWYLREFWHPVTQMWEICIPVLPRLLPHLQWWLQRSNLVTGVSLDPQIPHSLYRHLPNRMGCLPRRTHKSSGNEDSSIVIETLPRNDSKTVSVDSHRQYDSGGLSSESRGNSLLFSVSSMQRNCVTMRQFPNSVDSETYPRQSESNSGCINSIPCSSEYGMGVTSSNFSNNHFDMGSPPDRSVCHQFELQTGDICLSNPRPESLGSGCNNHLLERDVQLHLPTISSSPQDFTQDKRGWLQDHSYNSGLAKTILVPGSPTIIVCKTASSSLERGPFVSIQGKEASSRPGETPSARMVAVRTSIRQRGFSEKATKRISGADRQSTGAIYDSKWSIFCS